MRTPDANRPETSRTDHSGDLAALLGKPPLFETEESAYRELVSKTSSALLPRDIFERILVADFAYLSIEIMRLRRAKVHLLRANEHKGVREALTPIVGRLQADTLAQGWGARDAAIVKQVKTLLRSAGLSTETIRAQTFAVILNEIERIEDILALAEARRNATLREIDRHRRTLGQELRRFAQQLDDDQLGTIESVPIALEGATN